MSVINTTGEFRRELVNVFFEAKNGKISGDALRGVIGAANQINTSLAIEIKMAGLAKRNGVAPLSLGAVPIATLPEAE